MDFIFNLPKNKKTTRKAILVVVDKLTKRAHFIALPAEHKAEDTAKVFYSEVILNIMDYLERLYLIEMYGLLHRFGKN